MLGWNVELARSCLKEINIKYDSSSKSGVENVSVRLDKDWPFENNPKTSIFDLSKKEKKKVSHFDLISSSVWNILCYHLSDSASLYIIYYYYLKSHPRWRIDWVLESPSRCEKNKIKGHIFHTVDGPLWVVDRKLKCEDI